MNAEEKVVSFLFVDVKQPGLVVLLNQQSSD